MEGRLDSLPPVLGLVEGPEPKDGSCGLQLQDRAYDLVSWVYGVWLTV